MENKAKDKIMEKDLYEPIYKYLTAQGYDVHSEVKDCDITATRGEELLVVEMKTNMNLTLLVQATQRQRAADSVYVAVPRPKGGLYSANWKHICHLLRRLELGLIFVSFTTEKPAVEIVLHPTPFDRTRSRQSGKKKRHSIIKEIEGRYADFNVGGSCRTKLMTAYRENSIHVACCLDRLGPLSPKKLKELGTGPKTQSILGKNFYGWFERVGKGIYGLTEQGKVALTHYPELAAHYRDELDKNQLSAL